MEINVFVPFPSGDSSSLSYSASSSASNVSVRSPCTVEITVFVPTSSADSSSLSYSASSSSPLSLSLPPLLLVSGSVAGLVAGSVDFMCGNNVR